MAKEELLQIGRIPQDTRIGPAQVGDPGRLEESAEDRMESPEAVGDPGVELDGITPIRIGVKELQPLGSESL